jgi:hypothetical protein
MIRIRLFFAMLVALVWQSAPSSAADFERYCNLAEFSAPVRQTIIIIDEHHIFPEAGNLPEPRNGPWRKFIGNLLFIDAPTLEQNFLPRERLTIFIMRKDGSGARALFAGCLPFFSLSERTKIGQSAGVMQSVNTFFGTGPVAAAKKDMELFRVRIGDGVRDALQASELSVANPAQQTADIMSSGSISSFRQGNFVNLAYGIPRVVIYSDMARFFTGVSDRVQARQVGLEKGMAASLNLQGAEVHVVGMSGGTAAHDALGMFFLAAHGELLSTGSAVSLPRFAAAPAKVTRYQGTIQYPQTRFPIRIRLATDLNGTLVNSWVSVQTNQEQFSPLHGVLTCAVNDRCTYSGDDVFSQVWNLKRDSKGTPFLDPSMPFGGARSLNFVIENNTAKGTISDSLIKFEGLQSNKLEFVANQQATALF